MRLDQYIALHFGVSRAQAAKRVKEGRVRCNGKITKKVAFDVTPEDHIEMESVSLNPRPSPSPSPSPNPSPIPILYEDASCLVIDKPQGIEVTELLEMMKAQEGIPSLVLAHRLDKGTSGCLLIAKDAASCGALQKQFQEHSIEKIYRAIVMGTPKEKAATIDAPVGRSLTERTKMSLFRTSKSRSALTSYRVLSTSKECSLLECRIATGRTHQIRVHLSSIGHPILGDPTYGSEQSRALSKRESITEPCLHARFLAFESPKTKKRVRSEAPLPPAFEKALEHWQLRS